MRRMYSEQELSKIIKVVFEEELESGALDESIADAVDAYLVENPVDITALEGKTIAPAVVNATTSVSAPSGVFTELNGESTPSVKPIYCHPIYLYIRDNTDSVNLVLGCMLILDNNPTAYNETTLKAKMKELMDNGAMLDFNGVARANTTDAFQPSIMFLKVGTAYHIMYGGGNTFDSDLEGSTLVWHCSDGVNKVN